MPITEQTAQHNYTATASQTNFSFTFTLFQATTAIAVYVNGVEKTLTTDYTVVKNDGSVIVTADFPLAGGKIVFGAGLTVGDLVTIKRVLEIKRGTDYQPDSKFYAEVLDKDLDTQTAILQDINRELSSKVGLAASDAVGEMTLPPKAERASKIFAFDVNGNPIASAGSNIAVTSFGATLLDDADASTALTTLGETAYGKTLLDDADASSARATLAVNQAISGQIILIANTSVPTNFLECDGSAISRTTYATLFTAIDTTYGVGDGSTTFNIPDLRGEFIRGWDNGRGVDSGRAIATSQTDAMQGHNHSFKVAGWQAAGGTSYPGIGGYASNSLYTTFNTGSPFGMIADGTNGTPRISSETRSRNIALMFCIKY